MIFAKQRGIAVGVASHQRPQLDSLGRRRQCAQCGVGLEHRLVGGAERRQLVEVVHHENRVESGRFGFARLRYNRGEELFDASAVAEVGDLQSQPDGHAFTVTTGVRRGELGELSQCAVADV